MWCQNSEFFLAVLIDRVFEQEAIIHMIFCGKKDTQIRVDVFVSQLRLQNSPSPPLELL